MNTPMFARSFNSILAVTLLCLPRFGLAADEAADLDKVSVEIETTMKHGQHREVYYTGLSKQVGVEVSVLERQRAEHRLGYGDFAIAHLVAKESGQPFEVILAEHRSKRGWGAIAKAHGLKLGPIVSSARKSSQSLKEKKKAVQGAPADKGKPGQAQAKAQKPADLNRVQDAGRSSPGSKDAKGKSKKGGGRKR